MKKILLILIFMFSIISLSYSVPSGEALEKELVESLKIETADIPGGFVYGKIPEFAKNVLKDNPWVMDRAAIDRLAQNIYPDGNSKAIKSIYMSILARKEVPYGDDIVYYALVFNDSSSAKNEIRKLNEFSSFNKDRSIVITRDNVAVYIHVDDAGDYTYIKNMAEKVKSKLYSM